MMRFLKRGMVTLVTALLLLSTALYAAAEETAIDYVVLGDSIAAGVNSEGQLGQGYADFIEAELS